MVDLNPTTSTVTSDVGDANTPIKSQQPTDWIVKGTNKNKIKLYTAYKRPTLNI